MKPHWGGSLIWRKVLLSLRPTENKSLQEGAFKSDRTIHLAKWEVDGNSNIGGHGFYLTSRPQHSNIPHLYLISQAVKWRDGDGAQDSPIWNSMHWGQPLGLKDGMCLRCRPSRYTPLYITRPINMLLLQAAAAHTSQDHSCHCHHLGAVSWLPPCTRHLGQPAPLLVHHCARQIQCSHSEEGRFISVEWNTTVMSGAGLGCLNEHPFKH